MNSPKITIKDVFTQDVVITTTEKHLSVSGKHSKILGIKQIIRTNAQAMLSSYDHLVAEQHVSDQYGLDFPHYKIVVVIDSYGPLYNNKKRVTDRSSELKHNRVEYLLQQDWELIKGEKSSSEIAAILTIIKSVFSACSEQTVFEIEHDTGYWGYLYVDSKNSCSASIIIEKK